MSVSRVYPPGYVTTMADRVLRALQKKLRHIDSLKRKRDDGEDLDTQQTRALQREAAVRAELSSFTGARPSQGERAVGPPGSVAACGHCRGPHVASACTFGADGQRFLLCGEDTCFARQFLVPLRRCCWNFTAAPDTLDEGRLDVGLRCINAALFLSQGLRHNAKITLALEGRPEEPVHVSLAGGVVRNLSPSEARLAARLRVALDNEQGGDWSVRSLDARSYSQSALRGIDWSHGGMLPALRSALSLAPPPGPPVVLFLESSAPPVDTIPAMTSAAGIVVVVGDDRGLPPDEKQTLVAAAEEAGAVVMAASIGAEVLFASHAIVVVNHYLDKLHVCTRRQPRDYRTDFNRANGRRR